VTDTEDQIRQALRARVDRAEPVRTPLGDVVSTAHGIRRRRRVTTGVLAGAAVVAFAVPAAVVVHLDRATTSTPVASSGPSTSASSSPGSSPSSSTTAPAGVPLNDLPVGHAPRISYLLNSDFVSAEGNRTTLPAGGQVLSATPYHGGFLVAVDGPDGKARVLLLDNTLHKVWERCGEGTFGLSGDQLETAFVTGPCDGTAPESASVGISTGMGDGEQTVQLRSGVQVPIGVLVAGAVVTSSDHGAWVNDFRSGSQPIPGLGTAAGLSPDGRLVSGQVSGQPDTGAVVDLASGQQLWAAAGWQLQKFSPDGSQVLALRWDASGATGWAVFDATSGDLLHHADLPAGYTADQVAWEDDGHLLLNVWQDRTTALLRSDLTGRLERATDVQPDAGHYVIAPRT
jgi:hypothetical protein